MKKQNIIIEAVITTKGPLSIAMPVAQGGRANEYNNFPIMARGQDEEGKLMQTAYLPASTVRGFLRRASGLAAMEKRGIGKTTLQQAYSDILGQSADAKEEVDLIKLSALRDGDPILDLFGSWSIKSRLLVSNFLPKTNVLPQAITGVRKDLEDTDGVLEFLSEADRLAYYNRSDVNSQRAAADAVVKSIKRELYTRHRFRYEMTRVPRYELIHITLVKCFQIGPVKCLFRTADNGAAIIEQHQDMVAKAACQVDIV